MNSSRIDAPLAASSRTNELKVSGAAAFVAEHPSLILSFNFFIQNVFWHVNELIVSILCFGCVLELCSSKFSSVISPLVLLYIVGFFGLRTKFVRTPKVLEDLKKYRTIAIDNEKKLLKRIQDAVDNKSSSETDGSDDPQSGDLDDSLNGNQRSRNFKLPLSDSTYFRGFYHCIHMEYLPTFKVCKFFFWFYFAAYIAISLAVLLPSGNAETQYFLMLFF